MLSRLNKSSDEKIFTYPVFRELKVLSDDNPNNNESASGRLGAFMNQVDTAAERRDTLTRDQADNLRTQAEDIRTKLLDC
jgi:hypothetical protein